MFKIEIGESRGRFLGLLAKPIIADSYIASIKQMNKILAIEYKVNSYQGDASSFTLRLRICVRIEIERPTTDDVRVGYNMTNMKYPQEKHKFETTKHKTRRIHVCLKPFRLYLLKLFWKIVFKFSSIFQSYYNQYILQSSFSITHCAKIII